MLPDGAFHEQNEKIQQQILEMNLTWLKNPPPFFSTSMYCPFYFRRYKSKDWLFSRVLIKKFLFY